jgi:hypothetical protein
MEAVWCSLSPYRCSTFLSSCIAVKKMVPIPYSCVPSFLHFLSPISQSLLVIADESALWKEKIIGSEKSYFKATFLRDFFSFFERSFLFELKHSLAIICPIELVDASMRRSLIWIHLVNNFADRYIGCHIYRVTRSYYKHV